MNLAPKPASCFPLPAHSPPTAFPPTHAALARPCSGPTCRRRCCRLERRPRLPSAWLSTPPRPPARRRRSGREPRRISAPRTAVAPRSTARPVCASTSAAIPERCVRRDRRMLLALADLSCSARSSARIPAVTPPLHARTTCLPTRGSMHRPLCWQIRSRPAWPRRSASVSVRQRQSAQRAS
jgi:hypothetical protein